METKRHILYLNEGNEISYEQFFSLQIRTEQQVIIDYNPSDNQSWIYDLLEQRPDEIEFIKSTYRDNPFLPIDTIKEIENLKYTDDDYYRIYALGERGSGRTLIFQHKQIKEIDYHTTQFVGLGMDFGYSNDPTTIVEVWKGGINDLYVKELLYKTKLNPTLHTGTAREELDAAGRQGLCLVCLDCDTNTLIRPCNHVVLCHDCAASLSLCPLDRYGP